MEMLIPIPVALALAPRARLESRLFHGFAAAIMGMAQIGSLSRGGMLSLAAALVFLAVMLRFTRSREESAKRPLLLRPAFSILLLLVAIVVGVIWVGADFDILKRIAHDPLTTSAAMDRQGIWSDTLTMFRANPILGIGLGAFETVYPMYGQGNGSLLIQFAHNDYLQIMCDAGLAGGAVALWFILVLARSARQTLKVPDASIRAIALGCTAGIFALLVHSLFDFNLQIPSNALLFLLLAAVVSTASVSAHITDPSSHMQSVVD